MSPVVTPNEPLFPVLLNRSTFGVKESYMYFTKRPAHLYLAVSIIGALMLLSLSASANQPTSPVYDSASVVSVSGRVESVEEHQCSFGWSNQHAPTRWLGTHTILSTEYGTLDVHLGPSSYLKENHFTLTPGDEIEVTGSKVNGGRNVIVIAKELEKGSRFLELRDKNGRPYWDLGTTRSTSPPPSGTASAGGTTTELVNTMASHQFKSSNDLLRDCQQPEVSSAGLCAGYILGVLDVINLEQNSGATTLESVNVCLPLTLDVWQATNTIKRYIFEHPEARKLQASELVLRAAGQIWGCPGK